MSKWISIVGTFLIVLSMTIVTVQTADAAIIGGKAYNQTGARVWLDCNLGKENWRGYANWDTSIYNRAQSKADGSGGKVYSGTRCPDEVDAVSPRYENRCVVLYSWGERQGTYRANANNWFKIRSHQSVHFYTSSYCGWRGPWLGDRLTRLKQMP